jgi:hypothetical protein
MPWTTARFALPMPYADISSVWGLLICLVGIGLLCMRRRSRSAALLALATLLALDLAQFAMAGPIREQNDITAVAQLIRQAQMQNQPVAHIGWHHGLYEFSGRLLQPLAVIQPDEISAWCERHPDGLVVAMDGDLQLDAAPVYSTAFRDARVSVWRSADAAHARLVDIRKNR